MSKPTDPRWKMVLQQVATLLTPYYEQKKRWFDAGKLLEQSAYYPQALTDYLKVNSYGDAARCAELGGDLQAAEQLYLRANMLLHAADIAKGSGNEPHAKELFLKAIDYFVEQKDFRQAALAAEKAGMVKKAIELQSQQIEHVGYSDSKYMYQELVERAVNIHDLDVALDMAIRGDLYEVAIDLALKNNRIDQVPEYYRKYLDSVYPKERPPIFRRFISFLTEHASQNVVRSAYHTEIDSLVQHEEYLSAADLAHQAKMPESDDLYRKAMTKAEQSADFAKAALAATKLGLAEEADYYRNLATFVG